MRKGWKKDGGVKALGNRAYRKEVLGINMHVVEVKGKWWWCLSGGFQSSLKKAKTADAAMEVSEEKVLDLLESEAHRLRGDLGLWIGD